MLETEALIATLWTDIHARLMETEDFQVPPPLTVIRKGDGDPEKQQAEALAAAGYAGSVVLVAEPRVAPASKERLNVTVAIDVAEDPVLNRGVGGTRRRAVSSAECIVTRLRNWQPPLSPCSPLNLTSWDRPDEGADMVHRLIFSTAFLLN